MHHGGGGGAGHGHGGHHGGHHSGHGAHHHHHHGGAPSSSASWNMAMQADSFWVNMLKANSKPLLVVFGVIGAMFGWLCLLHYLHQKDNPQHVVSNNVWNQQLTAVNPREAAQSYSQQPAEQGQLVYAAQPSAPSVFGLPRSAGGESGGIAQTGGNAQTGDNQNGDAAEANQPASGQTRPSLAPLMFSGFMPGGYQSAAPSAPQISAASMYAPSSYGAPAIRSVMPTRVHSAERFRMVVSR